VQVPVGDGGGAEGDGARAAVAGEGPLPAGRPGDAGEHLDGDEQPDRPDGRPDLCGEGGVQPGRWWSAGSQAWSTLAAMDMTEPKTNPVQATSWPPARLIAGSGPGRAATGVFSCGKGCGSTGSPPPIARSSGSRDVVRVGDDGFGVPGARVMRWHVSERAGTGKWGSGVLVHGSAPRWLIKSTGSAGSAHSGVTDRAAEPLRLTFVSQTVSYGTDSGGPAGRETGL
jgi:hypothetical protein